MVSSQINKAINSIWKRPKSRARQALGYLENPQCQAYTAATIAMKQEDTWCIKWPTMFPLLLDIIDCKKNKNPPSWIPNSCVKSCVGKTKAQAFPLYTRVKLPNVSRSKTKK